MIAATKEWIERSINAVSTFVDGCHQAGDNASVEYLRGNLTLGDLRGLLAAVESARPEALRSELDAPTVEEIEEFRREHIITAHLGETAEAGLEPWALKHNRILTYLCYRACAPSPLGK